MCDKIGNDLYWDEEDKNERENVNINLSRTIRQGKKEKLMRKP